jgi:hypothetical protein
MNASRGGPNNEGDMQDTLLVEPRWEHYRQDLFFFLVVSLGNTTLICLSQYPLEPLCFCLLPRQHCLPLIHDI